MKLLIRTLTLLLPLLAVAPRTASAQPESSPSLLAPDEERRRLLFQEGKEAIKARKWDLALAKLSAAWQLKRSFDVALVLSQAEFKQERFAESAEHLAYYLRFVSAKEAEDNIANARQALAAAKAKVATVRVTAPKGAEVTVDGRSLGTAPLEDAVFVAPGKRVFAAQLGESHATQEVATTAATEQALDLVFPPQTAPSPTPSSGLPPAPESSTPVAPRRNPPPSYNAPAIAATSGGVALATGVVFLIVASGKDSDRGSIVDKLPGTNPCGNRTDRPSACDTAQQMADDARTYRAIGYTSFGVAAAAAVATYFLWPTEHAEESAARVVPVVSTDGSWFSLGAVGRF